MTSLLRREKTRFLVEEMSLQLQTGEPLQALTQHSTPVKISGSFQVSEQSQSAAGQAPEAEASLKPPSAALSCYRGLPNPETVRQLIEKAVLHKDSTNKSLQQLLADSRGQELELGPGHIAHQYLQQIIATLESSPEALPPGTLQLPLRDVSSTGSGVRRTTQLSGAGNPGMEDTAAGPRSFPLLVPSELLAARFGQAATSPRPPVEDPPLPALAASTPWPQGNHSTTAEPQLTLSSGSMPLLGPPLQSGHKDIDGNAPDIPSQSAQAAAANGINAACSSDPSGVQVITTGVKGSLQQDGDAATDMHSRSGADIKVVPDVCDTDAAGMGTKEGPNVPNVTMNPAGAAWQVPRQLPERARKAKVVVGESGDDVHGKGDDVRETSLNAAWMEKLTAMAAAAASAAATKAVQGSILPPWLSQRPWMAAPLSLDQLRRQQQESWANQWPGNQPLHDSGHQPQQPQAASEQPQLSGKSQKTDGLQPLQQPPGQHDSALMPSSLAPAAAAQAPYQPKLYADVPGNVSVSTTDVKTLGELAEDRVLARVAAQDLWLPPPPDPIPIHATRSVEAVLGGVHDYHGAAQILDELQSSAASHQASAKAPLTGSAKPQRQQLEAQPSHLASWDLVADAADDDGFRAAVQAEIAAAAAGRSRAVISSSHHPNRPERGIRPSSRPSSTPLQRLQQRVGHSSRLRCISPDPPGAVAHGRPTKQDLQSEPRQLMKAKSHAAEVLKPSQSHNRIRPDMQSVREPTHHPTHSQLVHQKQQQHAQVSSAHHPSHDTVGQPHQQQQQQQQQSNLSSKRGRPNIAFGTRKDELRPQPKRRRPTRQSNDENAPRLSPAKLPRVARMTAEELKRRPSTFSPDHPGASKGSQAALHPDQLAQLLQAYTPDHAVKKHLHHPAGQPSQDPLQMHLAPQLAPDNRLNEKPSQHCHSHPDHAGLLQSEVNAQQHQQQQQQQHFAGVSEQQDQAAGADTSRKSTGPGSSPSPADGPMTCTEPLGVTMNPIVWEVQHGGGDGVLPTDMSLAMPIQAPAITVGSASDSMSIDQGLSACAGPGGDEVEGSETSSLARSVGGWLAAHALAEIAAQGTCQQLQEQLPKPPAAAEAAGSKQLDSHLAQNAEPGGGGGENLRSPVLKGDLPIAAPRPPEEQAPQRQQSLEQDEQASLNAAEEYIPGALLSAFSASLLTHGPAQPSQLTVTSEALKSLAQKPASCDLGDPPGSHSRADPQKHNNVAATGPSPSHAATSAAAENARGEPIQVATSEPPVWRHGRRQSEEGAASSRNGDWTSSYCCSSVSGGPSWVTCLDPDCDASHTSWDGSTSLGSIRSPPQMASTDDGRPGPMASWTLPYPSHYGSGQNPTQYLRGAPLPESYSGHHFAALQRAREARSRAFGAVGESESLQIRIAQGHQQLLASGGHVSRAQPASYHASAGTLQALQGQKDLSASISSSSLYQPHSPSSSGTGDMHHPMHEQPGAAGRHGYLPMHVLHPKKGPRRRQQEVLEQILTASEGSSTTSSSQREHESPMRGQPASASHHIPHSAQCNGPDLAIPSQPHTANRANGEAHDVAAAAHNGMRLDQQSCDVASLALASSAPACAPASMQQQLPQQQGPVESGIRNMRPSQPVQRIDDSRYRADAICDLQPASHAPHAPAYMPAAFGSLRLPPLWIEVPEDFCAAGSSRQAAATAEQDLRPAPAAQDSLAVIDGSVVIHTATHGIAAEPEARPLHPIPASDCRLDIINAAASSASQLEGIPQGRQVEIIGPHAADNALDSKAESILRGAARGLSRAGVVDRQDRGSEPLQDTLEQATDQKLHLALRAEGEIEQQDPLRARLPLSDEQQGGSQAGTAQQLENEDEQQPLVQAGGFPSSSEQAWPISYEPTPSGSPDDHLQCLLSQEVLPGRPGHEQNARSAADAAPSRICEGLARAASSHLVGSQELSLGAAGAVPEVDLTNPPPSMVQAAGESPSSESALKPLVQRQLWRFPSERQPSVAPAVADASTPSENSGSPGSAWPITNIPAEAGDAFDLSAAYPPAPVVGPADRIQAPNPALQPGALRAAIAALPAITSTQLAKPERVLQPMNVKANRVRYPGNTPMHQAAQMPLMQHTTDDQPSGAPASVFRGRPDQLPNETRTSNDLQSTTDDGSSSNGSHIDTQQAHVANSNLWAVALPPDEPRTRHGDEPRQHLLPDTAKPAAKGSLAGASMLDEARGSRAPGHPQKQQQQQQHHHHQAAPPLQNSSFVKASEARHALITSWDLSDSLLQSTPVSSLTSTPSASAASACKALQQVAPQGRHTMNVSQSSSSLSPENVSKLVTGAAALSLLDNTSNIGPNQPMFTTAAAVTAKSVSSSRYHPAHLSWSSSSLSSEGRQCMIHDAVKGEKSAAEDLEHLEHGKEHVEKAFQWKSLQGIAVRGPGNPEAKLSGDCPGHVPGVATARLQEHRSRAMEHFSLPERQQDTFQQQLLDQLPEQQQQQQHGSMQLCEHIPRPVQQLWQCLPQSGRSQATSTFVISQRNQLAAPSGMFESSQHEHPEAASGMLQQLSAVDRAGRGGESAAKRSASSRLGLSKLWADLSSRPLSAGHVVHHDGSSQAPPGHAGQTQAASAGNQSLCPGSSTARPGLPLRPTSAPISQTGRHEHGRLITRGAGPSQFNRSHCLGAGPLGQEQPMVHGNELQETGNFAMPEDGLRSSLSSSMASSEPLGSIAS
ncbi:hypothetical protein WJX74_004447 [Apatococcus lobatus]|uniref:Uncharacterized protein n=1 Tax=Apatococcus lobatus TaxID=904363 RepID=A0AAW1RSL3_9CHLO